MTEEVVTEEVVTGSGMRWGSWDWARASPDCPNDSGFGLGGPYEAAGPSTHWNSGSGVVETFWRFQWYLEVQVACTEAACRVQCVLLRETARITSRSRDWFNFRERGAVHAGGGYRGRKGGARVCSGSMGA